MTGTSNLLLYQIKLTYVFNIRKLVTESNDSAPIKRSSATVASQQVKTFLFILHSVLTRIDPGFVKLAYWIN